MTIAYVYKWTHLPTLKWYVGSRTSKGCHPDDGYICSSKIVKPMILSNPEEWKREIIATGSSDEMFHLETDILMLFDARNDIRSFNGHNNLKWSNLGNTHTLETRKKISKKKLGCTYGPDFSKKQSIRNTKEGNPFYGKTHSSETKEIIRLKKLGQQHSEKTKQQMSKTRKGNMFFSDAHKDKISKALFNKPKSEQAKQKMRKPQIKLQCPHCNKIGGNAMRYWHFDNCKYKKVTV